MFLTVFIVAGFIIKIISEAVHELLGHGLFVLLFGGEITDFYISILWPYEFSRVEWSLPSGVTSTQMALIHAGGILVCLFTSFLAQAFLLMKKKIQWHFALTLFWLAFWTFMNSTGYLLIGGLAPFGDVYELTNLGVLTTLLFLVIGLIVFVIGFVALSWILRRTFAEVFSIKKASLGVIIFWFIIPIITVAMLANPERGLQWTYLPLTFIPALFSFVIEYFWFYLSKKRIQTQTISPKNKAVIKPAVMNISMGKPGVAQTWS